MTRSRGSYFLYKNSCCSFFLFFTVVQCDILSGRFRGHRRENWSFLANLYVNVDKFYLSRFLCRSTLYFDLPFEIFCKCGRSLFQVSVVVKLGHHLFFNVRSV